MITWSGKTEAVCILYDSQQFFGIGPRGQWNVTLQRQYARGLVEPLVRQVVIFRRPLSERATLKRAMSRYKPTLPRKLARWDGQRWDPASWDPTHAVCKAILSHVQDELTARNVDAREVPV